MIFSIDLDLCSENDLVAEVEILYYPADIGSDVSDWDGKDHWEIIKCSIYSNGKEIDLELSEEFLYSKVKQKLREIELMHIGGF